MSPTNPRRNAEPTATPGPPVRAPQRTRPAGSLADTPRRQGRRLAARLVRLAGEVAEPAALARRAAATLVEASGAAQVSLWQMPLAQGAPSGAAALECVGAAPDGPEVRAVREARAAAWLALRAGRGQAERPSVVEWPPRPGRPGLLALSVGVPHAGAARLAFVIVADGPRLAETAALLRQARGALDAVARNLLLAADLAQANRRNGQLQAIFANSSEAILTVDDEYHLVEVNNACADLLEHDRAEIVGRHCSEVIACQDERGQVLCFSAGCPLAQAIESNHATPYRDLLWRCAGDTVKRVSASFALVESSDGTRSVITARDISMEKAASRMQANFISMVSHDLRTPLTTINGYLEIVLQGSVGELKPQQAEFLTYAQDSTHELFGLVDEVLFITRVDSGQFSLRLHEVDVPALIAQTTRNFQGAALQAEVNLRASVAPDLSVIFADESRLLQVLSNLINNAIKFTPPKGMITVEASRDGDQMRFIVRDTGEGVPEAEQINIFERFVQLQSDSPSAAGGYGLGLAIARMIVNQHGGRIWVRNAPEGGAIFTFTIPLSLRPSPPEAHPAV